MSDVITNRLAEIEARTQAATPGPWEPGDVWIMAGVIWDDNGNRVGQKKATRCGYCNLGEPVWSGRADINGTVMRAHRHRDPDPYRPEHRISAADGSTVAGNYGPEAGGILCAEDTEFITHAREDIPALVAAVKAAQRHHEPESLMNGAKVCPKCSRAAGIAVASPCEEIRDIAAALGEQVNTRA